MQPALCPQPANTPAVTGLWRHCTSLPYLDFFKQLGHLDEVQPCINGAVNAFHGQGLVGSQCFQVGEIRF